MFDIIKIVKMFIYSAFFVRECMFLCSDKQSSVYSSSKNTAIILRADNWLNCFKIDKNKHFLVCEIFSEFVSAHTNSGLEHRMTQWHQEPTKNKKLQKLARMTTVERMGKRSCKSLVCHSILHFHT